MDLFASRLSAQLPPYIPWTPDPYRQGTDAMQRIWSNQYLYILPPFSMINKVLRKIAQVYLKRMFIVSPTWQSQVWYPILLKISIEKAFFLSHHPCLLLNHQGQIHPLITNKTLRLAAWMVSGNDYLK